MKSLSHGKTGSEDIRINGQMNTIAYHPVTVNGKNFLALYIIMKHSLATDVTALINQQGYFTTLIITIIGAVATITAFLIFSWNKRLETLVNTRTAELALANEQLKLHAKAQKEFINVAAHELRTPIQPILGLSELLLSKTGSIEQYIELLETINRNAKRSNRLSDDILDATKIESKSLELKKERFNLNDIILNAMDDIKLGKDLVNRNVQLRYQSQDIVLDADKGRTSQVISNLLSNAIKFTKKGSITIATKIEDNNRILISVKDTGSGVDPEILPELFSKFTARSFSGTGLGLYISKSIVEAHGGKIWAENNSDGKGATFTFGLPLNEKAGNY